jgi:hypothetical protein
MKPKQLPVNNCLLPTPGLRDADPRGPCGNYEAALATHVAAHPRDDVSCSCRPECRFWKPLAMTVEAFVSAGGGALAQSRGRAA